jgi:peptidoglycan/xylan/chitin deacetylase (PgdA/CDA1 family)
MRLAGLGLLGQVLRRVRNRFAPGALILLYHRVAELPTDPFSQCVSPRHFAEHLEVLKQQTRPVSLGQLVKALESGSVPARAVAVTLDDGYLDNLNTAKPLLENHCVPATVFVASGYVDSGREFWWDELDRLLLQPGTLPETLNLSVDQRTSHWELGKAAVYTAEDQRRYQRWTTADWQDPTTRHCLLRLLHRLLRPLHDGERHRVVDELFAWAGIRPEARLTHRVVTANELVRLAEGGLVEVGAHTVTHPTLSTLPPDEQRDQVTQNKSRLEEVLGREVRSFAYPYGSPPTTPRRRWPWSGPRGLVVPVRPFPRRSAGVPTFFNCRGSSWGTGTATRSPAGCTTGFGVNKVITVCRLRWSP